MMKPYALAALAVLTLTTASFADDYEIGDLTIENPMSFETAITAQTGAGYATITNTGDTPDTLVGVRADFPRVELHEVVTVDDVMSMRHLDGGLVIPAGGMVMLEPGGYHIMFMGLPGPFEVGDEIEVTLEFETAGEIVVMFEVEPRVTELMTHGDMEMDEEEASE